MIEDEITSDDAPDPGDAGYVDDSSGEETPKNATVIDKDPFADITPEVDPPNAG